MSPDNRPTAPTDSPANGAVGGTSVTSMLRGRAGLSPVMIGRHSALARLQGLVEVAEVTLEFDSADGPLVALVSGEPGVGKTRLLREFAESLPADVQLLSAQAQPGSMGRTFDVLGQLAAPGDRPGEGVVKAVEAAVLRGPTVLVVEDLHWIDADSAHTLEELCAQPWPQLVVIGTFRGNDLSRKAPGGELVLRLERQHAVEQVRLDRLDRSEVASLLTAIGGAAPSSAAVEAVYRRSGGNPFVVEELVRCCGPLVCIDDLKSAQLPWSLEEAVRQQLAGLADDERRVVDALAVFGDPIPFRVLADVAEMDDERLLAALRTLVAQGVVIEPTDDTFWFAHALVADAVQQQLLGRERRRLHERSYASLRESPSPDHAALARHALGAGQFDLIPAIAREGARRYLEHGASFQALRLAGEALGEAPNDPELLAVATDAAWRLEYGDEALAYAQRWLQHAVTDLDRIEALRFIGRVHHESLAPEARDEAVAQLEALAATLPAGMARGRCAGALAQLHMLAERNEVTMEWAERALADARRNGDQWLEAQARVEQASSRVAGCTRDEIESSLIEAHDLARRVGDAVLESRALNNLLAVVSPHSERGEWARYELREAAARSGLDRLGASSRAMWEADAAFAAGEMRVVRRSLAEALEHWGPGSVQYQRTMLAVAMLQVEEGLLDAALAHLASDNVCADEQGVTVLAVMAHSVAGRRAEVNALCERLLALSRPPDTAGAVFSMIEVGLALLQAGVPIERVRDGYFTWLDAHPAGEFVRRHLAGPILLAEGEPAAAVAALTEVLANPDAVLYRPTLGSLRTVLAQALLATGDRAGALAAVREALADLATWPGWRRERAEALLRRLEGSARSDGELTTREREVAALIAEGLTNGQIAERLFISPKTAAVHVSNILTKLGLSSRVEIAAWAVRHGVTLEPA